MRFYVARILAGSRGTAMISRHGTSRRNRRTIRLPGYDYSQAGAYFVTICTQQRLPLFGKVVAGEMRLNEAGRMLQQCWDDIPVFYHGIEIDEFVVMPNHIHGIIMIVGATPCGCPDSTPCGCPDSTPCGCPEPVSGDEMESGQPRGVAPTLSLPDVVHRFKTLTTKRYADGVNQSGWPSFPGKLWQRNYYEHIVRDDAELNQIREYIIGNPLEWSQDQLNPLSLPGVVCQFNTVPAQ